MQAKNKIMSTNKIAFKAGVLYMIAELFTRGISFLITPVFTRILPTAVYADVKIYESWIYLIAPIISLSVYQSVARAKFDYKDKYESYVSSIIALMAIITSVVMGLVFPFLDQASSFFGTTKFLFIIMLIYCFAYNSIQCIQLSERQLMHYKINILLTILAVVPAVVISVICVLHFKDIVNDTELMSIRIISFYVPTIILGLISIIFIFKKGREFINVKYWKYGIKYSLPLMICTLSTQVFYQSDKIMVRAMSGVEATAIVALATTIGYIMDILIHAVDNAWRPWLFEQLYNKEYLAIKKIWMILLLLMVLLTLGMVLFAPELVLFLGGSAYKESVWLVSPIVCGSLANFVMIGYTALEQFYKKTNISGIAGVLSALINLTLNFVFIYIFGYRAAAYTTLISYLISAFIHYRFVNRLEINDVLSSKKTFTLLIVIFPIFMLGMLLYEVTFIIRFLIILFAFLIIFMVLMKNYKKELLLLKRLRK